MEQVRNALAAMDEIAQPWQPHRLTSVNDYDVKLAKFDGEFVWHTHPDTDEFFLVLAGSITIRMRDRDVELGPHDVFVVPRGVEHCPTARPKPRCSCSNRAAPSTPATPAAPHPTRPRAVVTVAVRPYGTATDPASARLRRRLDAAVLCHAPARAARTEEDGHRWKAHEGHCRPGRSAPGAVTLAHHSIHRGQYALVVGVRAEHRRQGLGRALVDEARRMRPPPSSSAVID
jgi:hypothetical protein